MSDAITPAGEPTFEEQAEIARTTVQNLIENAYECIDAINANLPTLLKTAAEQRLKERQKSNRAGKDEKPVNLETLFEGGVAEMRAFLIELCNLGIFILQATLEDLAADREGGPDPSLVAHYSAQPLVSIAPTPLGLDNPRASRIDQSIRLRQYTIEILANRPINPQVIIAGVATYAATLAAKGKPELAALITLADGTNFHQLLVEPVREYLKGGQSALDAAIRKLLAEENEPTENNISALCSTLLDELMNPLQYAVGDATGPFAVDTFTNLLFAPMIALTMLSTMAKYKTGEM